MARTLLWLLASLGLASVTSVSDATPLKVMSAPNVLRVGTAEKIFVECQDCGNAPPMNVEISVWNFPTKNIKLKSTTVALNPGNKYQGLGELVIPPDSFDKDPNAKQFVYLRAAFPGYNMEKVVLVSFQSGFLFIQTDKTLYTPESTVLFRIFALTPGMKPVGADEATGNPASVAVEIVTPEGIVIPLDSFALRDGMYSGTYQLGEIVSVGQWKVVSRLQSNPQQTYSAEFEVKKYVLPSFEVKLMPESTFYYVDSQSFTVEVKAKYLFGQEVDGMAYVVFGVIKDGNKKAFPASLQRIPINNGKGEATLQRDHILKTFPNIEQLVGGSLFVKATVFTESGSEMVEGELRDIQIVTSPYSINFKKTSKYFKPGLSFDVTVTVANPDGSPAEKVPLVVNPGNVQATTGATGRARLIVNTQASDNPLTVTARTNDGRLPAHRQTTQTMVATPYEARSQNYIHISVNTADVKLGTNLIVSLNLNSQPNQAFDISYLIQSRGQLVQFGRQASVGQVLIALVIPVTKKMLPSFRLIVYYHPSPTEVVSDSVWVDVIDSCMGTLKLEPVDPALFYEPRSNSFNLRVTGDTGATVGLVAVDKGVYVLNNKHRLTQEKVWEIVEKVDTGCTPGGGKNSMGVFFDAGLLLQTDTASGTPHRQEVKCSSTARKKRASTLFDVTTTLASAYKDKLERECCLDGMKDTPLSYSCATRKLYITDGKACEDAFLHCCEELQKQRSELKRDSLILARSEEDDGYPESSEITLRTKFPESWEWVTFKIPPCTRNPNCEINTYEKRIPLPDSITTWQFTGISLSENSGICVGKPLEVVVLKPFFIDLKLPYSVVIGEQIEIRAILHNYIKNAIDVRIELKEHPNVCSSASKRNSYTQHIKMGPSTTRAVPFVIIPMKEGEFKIQVKAAIKDSWHSDGVEKTLRVVSNGVLTKVHKTVELDPKGGTQVETVNSEIPKTEILPKTKSSTKVFVTGSEQVGPLVENIISGTAMDQLMTLPGGCGEQNMYPMSHTVIATTYLDKTNQWEAVGFEKRAEALNLIKAGFQHEMQYAKSDGSFAVWPWSGTSTWLTAYVVKMFSMANNLVAIDNNVICNAVRFMILNAQHPDGMFRDTGFMYHRHYADSVHGRDTDAAMTAFSLIAMQESRSICEHTVTSMPSAIEKSVAYLERRLPSLTNPYAVAITSYALANEQKLNKQILFNFASPDRTHWTSPLGDVYTLEATGYGLLALVKGNALEEARPVVSWLTKQHKVGGGYGSTQATIMVYQAVSEYWATAKVPDYNLDVDLTVPGRTAPYNFRFNKDNYYTTRTSKNFDINENVKVIARGTGKATLTLVTQYYAVPKEAVSDCTRFNLSLEFTLDKVDESEGDIYKLRMEFFFKNEEEDASMSIIDIGIPTGFKAMYEDLDTLSEGCARSISRWEFNKDLCEKGSIILYLDKVAHNRIEELAFRMRQTHKVGILQPAAVSIYEYYDATKCVRYYHPQRRGGWVLRRCKGDECLCAEENCSMQKKGKISNQERIAKACESTLTTKIDFVYNVTLEEVRYDLSFDIYAMRIDGIIKDGTYDKNVEGQLRNFLSFPHCRESLNLQKQKGYLIMGAAEDTLPDSITQSVEYFIGERTWIEYWPRGVECQTETYRPTCLGLEALVEKYETFGCVAK